MLLENMLIPARHLVNGHSIRQLADAGDVHYFHLELERHEVILAESAAAESFVDEERLAIFHNANTREPRPRIIPHCAPRITQGACLHAVRRRLDALARPVCAA
jgi:hypothetical protein